MRYTHIFIDMDGTLVNSAPGVTHSVAYALEKCGITPPPAEELTCFIGPPLVWSFAEYYGMNEEECQKALAYYREYYRATGIFECYAYDGIEEFLKAMTDMGLICVLATSKPHVFANQILEYKKLNGYFSFVSGPEFDGTRNEKAEVIAYAMEQLGLTDPSKILMLGDREHDTKGAAINGMDSVGALWGFGDAEELLSTGAKAVFETPKDLQESLCKADFEAF